MMKTNKREHRVYNALLRIENVIGSPPLPFEKPSDLDFWVLELIPGKPEPLSEWQKRILPIIQRHSRLLKKWKKAGADYFLCVQTTSPLPWYPAVFQAEMLKELSRIDCTLEHSVDMEPDQMKQGRTRSRTVRRETSVRE